MGATAPITRAALLALGLAAATAHGQLCERDVFFGPDVGHDVALQRQLVALGAPGTNAVFPASLVDGGWQADAPLVGPLPGGEFGTAVDLDASTLAVGAPGENGQTGAVYTYRRIGDVWVQTQRLTWSRETPSRFGADVALDGDLLVVGAPADDTLGAFAGVAVAFERSGPGAPWIETQALAAGDASTLDVFGDAVAVDDEVVVVGAPRADTAGVAAGAAYVFERDPLTGRLVQTARLADATPQLADLFGRAVALADGVLWIGAPQDDGAEHDAGCVHVARRVAGAWTLTERLELADAAPLDLLGASVALEAGRGVAGAPARDGGLGAAAVFVDDGDGFAPFVVQTAGFGAGTLGFGTSVDLSLGSLAVGASSLLAPTGATYVYAGLDPWVDLGAALGGPTLAADGSLCPGTTVAVSVDDALPSALAALVLGFESLGAPLKGGTLVPTPDVIFGLATDPFGGLDLATRWPPDFPPGLDLVLQVWITDPAGPQGFTASNAVSALSP